ncbi:MAG: mechanosensitive ion channel family protein [Gammaproteobacteria bacterium]|nr:mechanosensitive ion channel family protein [Gammaproteobacteria bacterium]
MKDFMQWFQGLEVNYVWAIQIFLVVFTTLVVNYIWRRYFQNIQKKLKNTSNLWDDALWDAIHKPMGLLIWILGISYAAEITNNIAGTELTLLVATVRELSVIVCLSWFLFRFIRYAENNILKPDKQGKGEVDTTTVQAIAKLLRASVIITAVLIIMQTMGYSISGLLAFGGIGGLAVGFAAKDLLSNFFGGLMIYLDRPFKVGDWIRSPDREIEGTVEYIGWRQSIIRTFDKRPLYIPNSIFATIAVENPSRMKNRRIYETIGIRYDDALKVDIIIKSVKTLLQNHPEIDNNATLIVNLNKFAPSSLDFFIYTFTKTTDWVKFHQIKQQIMLQIIDIIDKQGAEIAFPTSTIHLEQGSVN